MTVPPDSGRSPAGSAPLRPMAVREYDPKQVALLDQTALDEAVTAAEKAFADAADLDALVAVRPQQLGDRAPVAPASRRPTTPGTRTWSPTANGASSPRKPSTSPCRPTADRVVPGTRSRP
jgi:hypothetical protein